MPDIFDAIKERRSIRKYSTQPVPQKLIEEVLVAAGWAPSAHNAQPWRFIVLANGSVKAQLSKAMADSWAADMAKVGLKIETNVRNARVERFANAPVLILACLTMDGMNKFSDQNLQSCERDLAAQSLGAAMQNLLLTAHSKGLGACWFCAPSFCKATVRAMLKIPDEVEPEALVAMGYPAENPAVPNRKMRSDYCFKDMWGGKL